MGEGFRSLPTSNERINALGSYAETSIPAGEEQQSHVAADGHPMGAEERPHGGIQFYRSARSWIGSNW